MNKRKPEEILQLFDTIRQGDRETWVTKAKEAYRFSLGEQLTPEQKAQLEKFKMPTFTINRMTPQLELMKYFCTANNPRWKAVAVEGTDSELAEIHQAVASHVWYISNGSSKFAQVMWDALTKSIGWFHVSVDPNLDDGLGEVVIDNVEPFEVFVDPRSRDVMCQDASYIMVSKIFTANQVVNMFPDKKKQILDSASRHHDDSEGLETLFPYTQGDVQDSIKANSEGDQLCRYFELYEKVRVKHCTVMMDSNPTGDEVIAKKYVMTEKEYKNLMKDEEFASLVIDKVDFYKTRVIRHQTLNADVELTPMTVLPGSNYPLVPVPYRHTGTPFCTSAAMDLVGKQQEINKAHQIMIHHANLSSSGKWLAEEGSIDEDKWEKNASIPGAILTYRTSERPPQQAQPLPLNSAFYNTIEMGKSDMEYMSGMHTGMMGMAQTDREPFRGMLAKDEFGTRRIKAYLSTTVEPALSQLGRVVDDYAKGFYEVEKILRMVDPEDASEWSELTINEVGTSEEAASKYFNDLREGTFDIRVIPGSTEPVHRHARLEMLERWRELGIVDDIAVIMESDIPKKKELLQRKSLYQELQGQVNQLAESLKDKEGTIETLSRQLVQAGIKGEINDAEMDIEKKKYALIFELMKQQEIAKLKGHEINNDLKTMLHRAETEVKSAKKDAINNQNSNNNNQKQE